MDSEKDMRPEESAEKKEVNRLFVRVTRDTLPRVVDKYPFLYLEHGRLEIDDSSIRWIDAQGGCVRLPVATISCLLLGPGTSVTHEAVKTATAANCSLCWVGEDSLLFYGGRDSPVSHTRNMLRRPPLLRSGVLPRRGPGHVFPPLSQDAGDTAIKAFRN